MLSRHSWRQHRSTLALQSLLIVASLALGGFLYFDHHRQTWMNQAEVSGILKLGVEHNLLAGWDYQDHDNRTDRRGAANYNTTPLDL